MIKIGNAQAFWGDRIEAPAELLAEYPDLDYLTLDYLSEVSLSIMAAQQIKDPDLGYAHDFIQVVKSLIPFWKKGNKVKVIANAGGLAPRKCAEECVKILKEASCPLQIGIIHGDDVKGIIKADPADPLFNNLDTGAPISSVIKNLQTANAYFGARPVSEALIQGADIVITGRVADPSLTVGPCIAHFGWPAHDFDKLAQATVAGHLIECGTQATGGISTDWLQMPHWKNIGFPVIEIDGSGNFVLTKSSAAGGRVTIETVKEQLLYEIGDPDAYLSPDVCVSLSGIRLAGRGKDRIAVEGAKGKSPPKTYKVSATYWNGYRAEGTLAIFGRNVREKALRCGQIILDNVCRSGYQIENSCVECIGAGDLVPGIAETVSWNEPLECMLRICVSDHRLEAVESFSTQIASAVTWGPQGITGYTGGRPHIRPVYGFWPCLIPAESVTPQIEFKRS
jgi:hypothetical protein